MENVLIIVNLLLVALALQHLAILQKELTLSVELKIFSNYVFAVSNKSDLLVYLRANIYVLLDLFVWKYVLKPGQHVNLCFGVFLPLFWEFYI